MKKLRGFVNFFWGHKYLWTIVFFAVLLGFLSEYSYWNRYQLHCVNEALRAEIQRYEEQYVRDSEELYALENNPEAVEHVARVHHFMKSADEDVYIIEEN